MLEKLKEGFTAVNLTALNFTSKVAKDIEKGMYQFIYLVHDLNYINLTLSFTELEN